MNSNLVDYLTGKEWVLAAMREIESNALTIRAHVRALKRHIVLV